MCAVASRAGRRPSPVTRVSAPGLRPCASAAACACTPERLQLAHQQREQDARRDELQRNLHAGNHKATRKAAARLAAFLLAMVAQSSLFPKNANLDSFSEQHDVTLPRGLGRTHRSVALTLLRDHAHLFAPCPAWVEPVVVCPTHITAQTASYERHRRDENLRRIALRDKIIDLGVLTADEEQLLMRVL